MRAGVFFVAAGSALVTLVALGQIPQPYPGAPPYTHPPSDSTSWLVVTREVIFGLVMLLGAIGSLYAAIMATRAKTAAANVEVKTDKVLEQSGKVLKQGEDAVLQVKDVQTKVDGQLTKSLTETEVLKREMAEMRVMMMRLTEKLIQTAEAPAMPTGDQPSLRKDDPRVVNSLEEIQKTMKQAAGDIKGTVGKIGETAENTEKIADNTARTEQKVTDAIEGKS